MPEEKTIDQAPVFIAAPARSGTVMMANLLHGHGIWIGDAGISKTSHVDGNVGAENLEIKKFLRSLTRELLFKNKERVLPASKQALIDRNVFKDKLEAFVPTGKPWLIKTSLTLDFNEVLMDVYPNARWVLMRRDKKDIMASVNNHPVMRKRRWSTSKLIDASFARQDEIFKKAGYVLKIDPDNVVHSAMAARNAVEFCGRDFSHDVFNAVVKPGEWKSWATE